MSDFKTALIEVVETAAPELEGKLQCGAVDAETPAPFATYSTPEELPIRTKDGICGYETLFEVIDNIYDVAIASGIQIIIFLSGL